MALLSPDGRLPAKLISLGRIIRPHGVHGGVLIMTYNADRPEAILEAESLWMTPPDGGAPIPVKGIAGKIVPKGVIAKLKGYSTREAAETLRGMELSIDRLDLPAPEPDEFYHADLLGLKAVTESGREIGRVANLMENGAGLILVVAGPGGQEFLVPFTDECVPEVDLDGGLVKVAEIPGLLG